MKKFLRLVLNGHQSTLDEIHDILNEKTTMQRLFADGSLKISEWLFLQLYEWLFPSEVEYL